MVGSTARIPVVTRTTCSGAFLRRSPKGLEALLVPSDGRLDLDGDLINVGERGGG
jgi:hypothetical protein